MYHPESLVISDVKHAELMQQSSIDSPFVKVDKKFNLDENLLFQEGRIVEHPDMPKREIQFKEIGNLRVSSGVLGISDFSYIGYDFNEITPLQRKVKPGEYIVEIVEIYRRIAGIRIRFSEDQKALRWYAANKANGNGLYGVDCGNLAIFDAGSLKGMSQIDKERAYEQWRFYAKKMTYACTISIRGENDAVISSSGYGDGKYPAFWGVNENDEIISLYIDFLILARKTEGGVYNSI